MVASGGSVLGIQCRVLIAEFSKVGDAGFGGVRGDPGDRSIPPSRHGQFLLCAGCGAVLWGIRRRFPPCSFFVLCGDVVHELCARAIHSVSVRVYAREKE